VEYKEFRVLNRRDKPLYHYTDLNGLLGILEHRNIWATSVTYLNDSEELKYAFGLMRKEIKNQEASVSYEDSSFLKELEGQLDETEKGLNPNSSTRFDNIFVCSFCEDGDLLSQWRGYCLDGDGYSVGFNFGGQIFEKVLDQGFELWPCMYMEEDQRKVIQAFLQDGLDRLHKKLSDWSQQKSALNRARAMHAINLRIEFVRIACILKHPKFSEEREWRWIPHTAYMPRDNEISYRKKPTKIPYIKIKLAEPSEFIPIDRIYVGPTPQRNQMKERLDDLLKAKGYSYPVETSIIPYRGGGRKPCIP
jgi:hypothetical protein